jgi:hypothetical protein
MLDDLALLERLTGTSFEEWRGDRSRGSFGSRVGREESQAEPRREAQTSSVTRS